MPDEEVREYRPFGAVDQRHEVSLDACRVSGTRQPESTSEPGNVRVDDDALRDAEALAQHDIGRLPGHAPQRQQSFHRPRHFATKPLHDRGHGGVDRARLRAPEVDRLDAFANRLRRRGGVVGRCSKLAKEGRGGFVDACIGRLCAENGRDQQFMRRPGMQLTPGVGVASPKGCNQASSTGALGWCGHQAMVGVRWWRSCDTLESAWPLPSLNTASRSTRWA